MRYNLKCKGNIAKPYKPKKMERYSYLSTRLSEGTITEAEKKELFILAFGEDYMESKDKGRLREYAE